MQLTNPSIKYALTSQISLKGSSANVPNEMLGQLGIDLDLAALANLLNIDLNATKHTYRLAERNNSLEVYAAYVAKDSKGIPSVFWGEVVQPLSEVQNSKISTTVEGDRSFILFEAKEGDLELVLPMMLVRKDKDGNSVTHTADSIRKAFKSNFASILSEAFEKAEKLVDLAPTEGDEPLEYKVVNVKKGEYQGKPKFEILVEDKGWFKANSALTEFLLDIDHGSMISSEKPMTLKVFPVTRFTNQGHPIVPVDYRIHSEKPLAAFVL